MMTKHPHQEPVVREHGDLSTAEQCVILLHGRGATADSILQMAEQLPSEDTCYLAPQASNRTWYPQSFLAPVEQNEPYRKSALSVITALIDRCNAAGIETQHVFIAGFSQGACLATEYGARHPQRYGGIIGYSGGLIGKQIETDDYSGDMADTPVFLGCSDVDPHIPLERVQETAAVFESLQADVDTRIYDGMGHTVNEEELAAFAELLTH